MKLKTTIKLSAAIGLTLCTSVAANAAITSYSQNFEGLGIADGAALANDGWLVNGLNFDGAGNFQFFYGNFAAPNGGPSFSAIATGEGGPAQGDQYINIYSDYGCCDLGTANPIGHGNGTDRVESYVFQEQVIGAGDEGTYELSYDARLPGGASIGPNSTAQAFLRTLDPNAGFSTSAFEILDSGDLSNTDWENRILSITLDSSQVGHIFQFGFFTTSSNFEDTGVFYDNINFGTAVPVPAAAWLFGSALIGLGLSKNRKQS